MNGGVLVWTVMVESGRGGAGVVAHVGNQGYPLGPVQGTNTCKWIVFMLSAKY